MQRQVYDNIAESSPTEPFEFHDRVLNADEPKLNLLQTENPDAVIEKLTPRIGTEIRRLQLSNLTDAQKINFCCWLLSVAFFFFFLLFFIFFPRDQDADVSQCEYVHLYSL